jgi:hypothetical protein
MDCIFKTVYWGRRNLRYCRMRVASNCSTSRTHRELLRLLSLQFMDGALCGGKPRVTYRKVTWESRSCSHFQRLRPNTWLSRKLFKASTNTSSSFLLSK